MLSKICTYKNSLPQGGVTSPALSNIICLKLDECLTMYTGFLNIVYTRYECLIYYKMIILTILGKGEK